MKLSKIIFILSVCSVFFILTDIIVANSVLGTYEQVTIMKPKSVKINTNNVKIVKDGKESKKIWVKNFLSDDIYAVRHTVNDDTEIYVIPEQKTKQYIVKSGCIVYSEDRVILSIDNKNDCRGLNTEDYGDIEIGSGGVKAGDVKISSTEVSVPGVKIGKSGVKISSEILSGIQYIGEKSN
ncbi:hypothetical protein [Sebaldella sp. S0638]|uniref:hypothetical protein n=1 Tax=Sebaldella sp. S0638 TaxID=2957809 RepID=UPI00209F5E67|nr:hypothetical protein [Sebaldella sp. S0638]MCP1226569.1 hypothetical protein [Sebaldella sp. S0638]